MQKKISMKAQSIRLALCNWLASVCVQSEKSVKKCWAASQLTIISWKSSQLKRLSEWVKEIYRESCCCGRVYTIHYIISGRVTEWIGYLQREVQRQPPLYHAVWLLSIANTPSARESAVVFGALRKKKKPEQQHHTEWKERRWWREVTKLKIKLNYIEKYPFLYAGASLSPWQTPQFRYGVAQKDWQKNCFPSQTILIFLILQHTAGSDKFISVTHRAFHIYKFIQIMWGSSFSQFQRRLIFLCAASAEANKCTQFNISRASKVVAT